MRTSTIILLSIALVCLVVCAEAKRGLARRIRSPKRAVEPKLAFADVEQFLIGFGEGLEYDWAANFTQCVDQEQATLDQFENAWTLLKNGFQDKSVEEIADGLKGTFLIPEMFQLLKFSQLSEVESIKLTPSPLSVAL
jgi:hypothetical protein